MQTKGQNSDDMLQVLKLQYLSQLKKRQLYIQETVDKIRNEDLTGADKEELRSVAHKLAGTGGTYGYQNITDTARMVETSLVNCSEEISKQTLVDHIKNLMQACDQALSDLKSDTPAPSSVSLIEIQANRRTMYKIERAQNLPQKPLILLIEDDESIVSYIIGLFKDSTDILIALNLDEALDLIQEYKPQLVLLANRIKGQEVGLTLLNKIKTIDKAKNTPVLIMTSSSNPEMITTSVAAGAAEYILKPFVVDDVVSKVNKRLNFVDQIDTSDIGSKKIG